MTARETAVKVLCRADEEYANLLLKDALRGVDKKDRGLASAIVYGVLTNRTRLDYVISHFCDFDSPSELVKNVLRTGAFQLLFTDKIPQSAAVNESVSIAKKYAPYSAGFVNSVLRKIAETPVELPNRTETSLQFLKVCYSYPKSIIKKWISMFGITEAEKLLDAMNKPSPMCIRVNRLKTTADFILQSVEGKAVLPNLIEISGGIDIENSTLYRDGYFTVMQKSSLLACDMAGVKPEMRVLDMCAAPGGKTIYLAELMENKGSITAWDLYEHRTKLIEKNAQRMGISIIDIETRDATVFDESLTGKFDLVLLDAPCSGFGVISQKPDIKWRKRESDLPEIQKKLIENAGRYVKFGGTLMYCTCTINDDENEKIVEGFITPDFKLDFMKTYLPHIDNTNGFFAARLIKKAEDD